MANPGMYKNFLAEGEIGPYVIVTHGTTDYSVKAATGATVPLVGVTDELGKLDNGRIDVCVEGLPEVMLGGAVAAGDPLTSDASGKAVKAAAAGDRVIGYAMVAGVSGDIIHFQFSLGTLAVAVTTPSGSDG